MKPPDPRFVRQHWCGICFPVPQNSNVSEIKRRTEMKRKLLYVATTFGLVLIGGAVWTMTARGNYESAPYKVLEKDGNLEIREYPDLMLASTNSKINSQGRDGSFGRLFRYISYRPLHAHAGSSSCGRRTTAFRASM